MLDSDKTKEQLLAELAAARRRIARLEARDASPDSDCTPTNVTADFYLSILNDAPALIWRAGPDAKCDWFNATWLAFTGRAMYQEIGDGWALGVHPDDFDRCLDTYLRAFAAREFFEMEYRLRHRGGEYRWILDIGCPFLEPGGAFGGYIGYCYDITQRKTDERFRLDVERIIRHDIKTPLHSLKTLTQVLFADVTDEELTPLLPTLYRAINNVINLVDSTDKIMQLERGQYAPPATRLDLAGVVRGAVETLAPLAAASGVALRPDFPDAAAPCTVTGDAVLLETLFANCLKNAIEASPPGADVGLACRRDGDTARVAIHNRGLVPEAIRATFFDKYVTMGKSHGTGLGTYSARLIARAHGGDITFTTSAEAGTTVTVRLPRAVTAAPGP
ncbi:MAG: PAS domain-containing sensor histidine kinase [Solidesulfovibrio sp.]|uniref:PAS domain-containing sensor histidine kinase n=1 Tax=Solidesulfovibrio sp. TaxID=2910990 RepID=UPI002B1F4D0D|nr:PAS domain-containing sensor histidine kinase [Solidesulfovibrio sp.]MEA4856751.1 PAS domain-containing sensor histidine kinase [Solidesulfovibrio sp.]